MTQEEILSQKYCIFKTTSKSAFWPTQVLTKINDKKLTKTSETVFHFFSLLILTSKIFLLMMAMRNLIEIIKPQKINTQSSVSENCNILIFFIVQEIEEVTLNLIMAWDTVPRVIPMLPAHVTSNVSWSWDGQRVGRKNIRWKNLSC